MRFGELLKEIRLSKKDSIRNLAKKMEIAFTFIDKIERGVAPVSENFYNKLIEVYEDKKEEITASYLNEVLPNKLLEKMEAEGKIQIIDKKDLKTKEIKVYRYDPYKEYISTKEFEYRQYVLPVDLKLSPEDFCIEVESNQIQEFYNKDILLFKKIPSKIQMLHKKIIAVKINNNMCIFKLEIENYKPMLKSLLEIYEPIEYTKEMKILGVLTNLIYRDLSEIVF